MAAFLLAWQNSDALPSEAELLSEARLPQGPEGLPLLVGS